MRVASVIGREFQLEVLRRVHARPDEELESALEEAVAELIVDEHLVVGATITYRFSHAFFQQTLADEILAPRRIRLHQQVARVLEEIHARRLEEHAAELAEHYSFSSATSDLSKAVDYATMASQRATEVFAHGEAARQLERALAVQELVDPDDRLKGLDLLLALGAALLASGETERVVQHVAPKALALAEGLGDRSRSFRICRLTLECLFVFGGAAQGGMNRGLNRAPLVDEYRMWAERAGRYAEPDSVECIYADLALAHALVIGGQFVEVRALRLKALALARQHRDAEALFNCAASLMMVGPPQHWDERVRLAEECASWPRQGVSTPTLGLAFWYCGMVQLMQGDRAKAEEHWGMLEELADRTRVATVALYAAEREVVMAIVDGRLEEALLLIRRFADLADESGATLRGRTESLRQLIAPALFLGRADIWLSASEALPVPASQARPGRGAAWFSIRSAARALCLAQLGREEEARAVVGPVLNDLERSLGDEPRIAELVMLLQAAIVVEDQVASQALAERLTCVAHLIGETGTYTCIARHLGDAAALTGDREAARAYYLQALDSASETRFRPELALTHLCLAELLLEEAGDITRTEALAHLDIAIPQLRDMRMQPSIERALALRESVAPAVANARASASDTLTVREREIARLVADGRSNRDIADTLMITEGTVEVHVKHILSKLGYRSRTQVAGWFARQRSP
jgi:DNA-binding CsgD family transcriptional regulator